MKNRNSSIVFFVYESKSEANNWLGFEFEIGDFFFIGEPISFIVLEL